MSGRRLVLWLVLVIALALAILRDMPVSAQQAGTTLTATKTATGHSTQTFEWSIEKSVSPDTWNLLPGETITSQYSIAVTRSTASVQASVKGQICMTNRSSFATENLQIVDVVQSKVGSGPFQYYESTTG